MEPPLRSLDDRNALVVQWMPLVDRMLSECRVRNYLRDECRSEGYLALIRAAATWRAEGSATRKEQDAAFNTYAWYVIRNTIYDFVRDRCSVIRTAHRSKSPDLIEQSKKARKVSRLRRLQSDTLVSSWGDPVPVLGERETIRAIPEALRRLCKRDRDILYYRYYDGLQYRQIASILGVTDTSARNYCLRALERLRKEFNGTPHKRTRPAH
jgi:RNA polymerase sigma factor (sigma-70 family)